MPSYRATVSSPAKKRARPKSPSSRRRSTSPSSRRRSTSPVKRHLLRWLEGEVARFGVEHAEPHPPKAARRTRPSPRTRRLTPK